MEFALKTAFINTFPTQPASPATCVPPSTCPFAECTLRLGHDCLLVWARCPRETLQTGRLARGARIWLPRHHPPWLSPHLDTLSAYALGTFSLPRLLPAPHPMHQARATRGYFCHAPRPRYQPVHLLSPALGRCG